MVGSALAIVALLWHPRERRALMRTLPVLGSVVSVGVLVSIAQFAYSAVYLPAAAPPSLTISAKLDRAEAHDGQIALRGTVTIHNTAGTRVNALASVVSVIGTRTTRAANEVFPVGVPDADGEVGALSDGPPSQRYWNDDEDELVLVGRLFAEGTYFQSDEAMDVPVTVMVPARTFDVVFLRATVFFARGTVLLDWNHTTRQSLADPGTTTTIDRTPIVQTGWLSDLIRARRSLRTAWTRADDSGLTDVEVGFDPAAARITRSLGYSTAGATAQTLLWPR